MVLYIYSVFLTCKQRFLSYEVHISCIFFFFLRHYNFREVLAFSTSFFHLIRLYFLYQSL